MRGLQKAGMDASQSTSDALARSVRSFGTCGSTARKHDPAHRTTPSCHADPNIRDLQFFKGFGKPISAQIKAILYVVRAAEATYSQ